MKKTSVKVGIYSSIALTGIAIALCSPLVTSKRKVLEKAALARPAFSPSTKPLEVYFKEDFRNYRAKAPTTVDDPGIIVFNDSIFAKLAGVTVDMEKSGPILKNFSPFEKNLPNLKDFDLLFKFRLQESTELGHFDVHLRQNVNGKVGDVIIGISHDKIGFSSKGIEPAVKGTATLPFELKKNAYHDAVIKVKNGKLSVFIDNNRIFEEVVSTEIPNSTSAGVNFYGYEHSPFRLTNIVLRDPAPLPAQTIWSMLPAPQEIDESAFKKGATETVEANDVFGATIITGKDEGGVKVTVSWDKGDPTELKFATSDTKDQKNDIPDAIIKQTGLESKQNTDIYIRPMMRRYRGGGSETDTYKDIMLNLDELPKASEHPLKVEFRTNANDTDLYLDGSMAHSFDGNMAKSVEFAASPSGSVGKTISQKTTYDKQKYFPVDIASQHMAKSFVNGNSSVKSGLSEVKGIPIFATSAKESADVGLVRAGQGNWALEADEYTARSPFDGLLTEIHARVPSGAPYSKAWVLAAVDPDASKDPILTTRITRYKGAGVGHNMMADTTITLPRGDEKTGDNVEKVGDVTINKNGKDVKVPLYLVEVPIKSGEIIDLYKDNSTLDLDFMGKTGENNQQIDFATQPDVRSTSAVQIFGATLEKAPVGMDMEQSQHGNVFANDEKPETTVVLSSFAPSKGKLSWTISDVDDKKVKDGSTDYNFAKVGEEKKVLLPLDMGQKGWYKLDISAEDALGNVLYTHAASFALLDKDLRKAKYDSPYGTWWWAGTHSTNDNLEEMGPLMFKAGLRKAAWVKKYSDEQLSEWFITRTQIGKLFDTKDLTNPEEGLAKAKMEIDKQLKENPHVDEILIFHESGPRPFVPGELIGIKPHNPDSWKKFGQVLNVYGKFLRENYPQLKIVVGNHNESVGPITAVLRNGGNPDYIDFVGMEAASQTIIPEKMQDFNLQGMQMVKDIGKVLSGKELKFTGTYELTYRAVEDLGADKQAEFYTRDALISLANEFSKIGPGTLSDTTNAYFNRYWGRSGFLKRMPYNYPKKSYVAFATLTNELDRVKFRRQVPTGSTTAYAVEYDRADKKLSTSLWAARGMADFNITFDGDTTVRVVDMYGRAQNIKTNSGKITVNAGKRPVYLTTDKTIKSIILSNRTFPGDEARAKLSTVVAPLDDTNAITLDKEFNIDTPLIYPIGLPIWKKGSFNLRQVEDAEKGKALELELDTSKDPDLSKYFTEYTTIRLKNPLSIKGKPDAIGVWVNGNSNWGNIMFEFEDAKGEVWQSLATTGWGVDVLDWPGYLSTNFDGWSFISFPLHDTSLFKAHSPGPVSDQWVSGGGNKIIDYPIKARAIIVGMNRQPIDLRGFTKATNTIRLKGLSGVYEK